MIRRLLHYSTRHPGTILTLALLWLVAGLYNLSQLSIDAVPDVTNRQVQINALAPALSAEEVERRVTFPLEMALAGMPHAQDLRSLSQSGLSQVTVVFDDTTDIYQARQWTAERLRQAELPTGVTTDMAPVSTGLGEVLYLRLRNDALSLRDRRELLDWVVKPQLRTVPGLADVNTWGGEVKQVHVNVDAQKLYQFGLNFDQVVDAVANNNANGGGAFITEGTRQQVVQVEGMLTDPQDLLKVSLPPLWLSQVATVEIGPMLRQGAITQDGRGEEAYAICLLLLGENGSQVVQRIKQKLPEIEKLLPPDSHLEVFLDRSRLIRSTLETAAHNLAEGGTLVVGLLFFFLLQVRAGLIVSSVIPLAMLFAVMGMRWFGLSANLMSLGAIDFGIIVDGSVIIVENCVRRLSEQPEQDRLDVIRDAAVEVRQATQFGELLILASYLPILTLVGLEGKMFRPMGWTVILALLGSMLCTLTVVPALCAKFLKSAPEPEHPVLHWLTARYALFLQGTVNYPRTVLSASLAVLLAGGIAAARLGSEFIPELSEGAIAIQTTYPPGTSLQESIRLSTLAEKAALQAAPGMIEHAVTRIGRPDIATDPMLTCQTDLLLELKPGTQARVMAALTPLFANRQGMDVSFTQPIKMRMMELIEGIGIRADLGIKIFGPDPETLARLGKRVARALKEVPGATDVTVEMTQGLQQLQVKLDRERLAAYGVSVAEVNRVVEHAVGCQPVTSLNNGNRRLDVVVRLPEAARNDVAVLGDLLVKGIPLRQLATIERRPGPVQVSRENGQRRVVVQANVRGRDLGSFVEDVKRQVATVNLPQGYALKYSGTYEKLQSGRARLALVVPLTFLVVFGLLYVTFGNLRLALLVFSSIPLAVTGGVLALSARGMALSISAAVGFVALAGVAVLNGVVMVTFMEALRKQGMSPRRAAVEGAVSRLRPVLMTASVAALGFVPMALSQGSGAEVQRPLATVVIGGLISASLLTLVVLPTLYVRSTPDGPRADPSPAP